MNNSLILNASDYFVTRTGQELPQLSATMRDLGTGEALYFAFLIWVCAVVVHELSHWIMMSRYRKGVKVIIQRVNFGITLQTGVESDYKGLTSDQKANIYLAGIIGGLIPIILAAYFHPLYLLVLPAYITGTYRDWQLLWGLRY